MYNEIASEDFKLSETERNSITINLFDAPTRISGSFRNLEKMKNILQGLPNDFDNLINGNSNSNRILS